jgi:hypothetical protein
MRVSEHYQLARAQPALDFVDVDVYGDVAVFVDPRALRLLNTEWGDECITLIQNFFARVLEAIRSDDEKMGRQLLRTLREPNETHLGLSKAEARGRALGPESARDIWYALTQSEAVQSGLLQDLEDTILMVEGVSADIVSDITTNIIRDPLIRYTREACATYSIPLEGDVDSGPLWDPNKRQWYNQYVQLPVVDNRKLLLVPKVIVRRRMDYDAHEYYRHYILEHLREMELSANTELVRLLKTGKRRVDIKALKAKYGQGKAMIVRQTLLEPSLLQRYRSDKRRKIMPPLTHDEIAEAEGTPTPDWDGLFGAVQTLSRGREEATDYENAVEQLLTALFYPSLANPQIQHCIHEGRKRIDITYTNLATEGFFYWLGQHFAASHVFVECKNYAGEVANPELDQLAGRFSPSRGQFGFLVCRSFDDKLLFATRCKDTAQDSRGFIVPLDDSDLQSLVDLAKAGDPHRTFEFLKARFDNLVM